MKRAILVFIGALLLSMVTFAQSVLSNGTLTNGQAWQLTDDGILTIDGDGEIAAYASSSSMPWYNYRTQVTTVKLTGYISSIGKYTFNGLTALTAIYCVNTAPATLEANTFSSSQLTKITAYVPADAIAAYQSTQYWSQMTIEANPDSGTGTTGSLAGFGILINSDRVVTAENAGEFNGYTQYLAHVQLNALDTVRIIDLTNGNATWMVDLDEASVGDFEGSAAVGYLVCNAAGCYDFYIKMAYQADQLYIGNGTDGCSEGVYYPVNTSSEHQYYVIGSEPLLYDGWDVSSENAYMTKQDDGKYVYVRESIGLVAGQDYPYKFIADHSYDVDTYPNGTENYVLTVSETAIYSVTFSLIPGSGGTATATKIGDLAVSIYTIIGDEILTGADWDATNTANDMTLVGDIWTLTKTNVYLPAGTYHYEVAGNHDAKQYMYPVVWNEYTIASDGTYTLTFTFDATEGAPSLNLTVTATEQTYYLIGSSDELGAWSVQNALPMPDNTITLDLPANIYEFKILTQYQSWDNSLGASALNAACSSADIDVSSGENVRFVLATQGVVTISVVNNQICATGNFGGELPISVYSVVGDEALLGANWDAENTVTEMSQQDDGSWVYVLPSVQLTANTTYEYKIIANHVWNAVEYPSAQEDDNYLLSVTENGTYSVTFTLIPGEGGSAATTLIEATSGTGYSVIGLYPLFDKAWDFESTEGNMTLQEDGTYTYQIESIGLIPGQYYAYKFIPQDPNGVTYPNAEENYSFAVDKAALYSVAFSVHPSYGGSGEINEVGELTINSMTIMGDSTLTGGDWDYFNTANDMTYNSGNWVLTKHDVYLPVGTYHYEVVGNHNAKEYLYPIEWNEYIINEEGIYDLTFTLTDPTTTPTLTLAAAKQNAYYLVGNTEELGSWMVESALPMENGVIALSLPAGAYEFKILVDERSWTNYLEYPDVNADCSSAGVTTGEDGNNNIRFTLAEAGEVTIQVVEGQICVTGNFGGNTSTTVIWSGSKHISWDEGGLQISADKFVNAQPGNKIVVHYTDATDGIEFKQMGATFSHLAGSREAYNITGDGELEHFLTPEAVDSIKLFGLEIIGANFTITQVDLLDGKQLKDGTTVWTGFFWADEWTTLELYNDAYKNIDLSQYRAIRFYSEAGRTDYVLNFRSTWEDDGLIADKTMMTNGDGYAELTLTDDLRQKMTSAAHWMIQFNKESGEAFNATDIVLVSENSNQCIIASGKCGADGDNVSWVLSCDSVLTISGTGAMATYNSNTTPWLANAAAIKSVVIEHGVSSLSPYAFYNSGSSANYKSLTHVSIPSSISTLSNNQFWQCPIQTVELNSEALMLNITSSSNNLMYIFGAQVRKYILGDSVLTIGKYAFYNQGDDSLRTIVLPQGLTTISAWGFGYLEHLQSIEIPANVTSIGGNAFSGCTNLRSVVIGSGVTSIASQAFRDCNSLSRVTSNAPTPPTIAASDAFSLQDTLLVPCEAKTLYQQTQFWQNFSKIICPDDMNTPTELTYTLTADWQFIMLPGVFGLSADDIVTDGEVVWATYNAERRAAGLSGWEIYSAATGFSGTKAFIVRAADANATLTIHIPDQAREPAGAALPLTYQAAAHPQNANWNFLGNPYPYEYNISAALLAQGIETPITVWNGTGYSTYTPGIDEYTLQPFEAFFIQLPDNGPETITFSSEYIAASGENDLLWDYTEAAPSANPDNGLYYASMVSDAVGTNNGLKGVKLNASGWAYFEKANVAGKLKLTFANRKVQTAYAVSVYNATKTEGENPVKGEKIADTDDVEFGSSATIALPAEVTGVYIERKTGAEGVLSKIEFKEGVAH